jgi:enamine deaminase RidA (YjgF/YER057c/UK114 family)
VNVTLTTHRLRMVPTIDSREATVTLPDNPTAAQVLAAVQPLLTAMGEEMSKLADLTVSLNATVDTVTASNQAYKATSEAKIAEQAAKITELEGQVPSDVELTDLGTAIAGVSRADIGSPPAPVQ